MTGLCWIASYPKSGNTWLRLALRALVEPGSHPQRLDVTGFAPDAAQLIDIEEALDLESGDLSLTELRNLRPLACRAMAASARRPLYRKVHDAWQETANGPLFPPDVTLGWFYIVRDPRDVAVSWAHFAGGGLEAAVAMLCDPRTVLRVPAGRPVFSAPQHLSCWSGHVRSWLNAPGRGCVLRYEDLLADPAAALGRVAAHAGIAATDADIMRAVKATDFATLRTREISEGFDGGQVADARFFRSGTAGQWRNTLPDHLALKIWSFHQNVMSRFGYGE
jgi:aryl sulfotransferase